MGLTKSKQPAGELSIRQTQKAIKLIKDTFENRLASALRLERVSAPIIVTSSSGINDDLNGIERKVVFDCPGVGENVEIVQSLAKWKRMALRDYNFGVGEGLYTDMNAIRRDDDVDNIHSIYVDQLDWEKVIGKTDRNIEFLKETVQKIVDALYEAQLVVYAENPNIYANYINRNIHFITTQELEDRYPDIADPKMREDKIAREYGTVFLMQIGGVLRSGQRHGGRAPDYDDWSLNGDIIVWNEQTGAAFELSSMGIRVDAEALSKQLSESGCEDRMKYTYHKRVAGGELPLTIGGGIGQSRICMFVLNKKHIGEVQSAVWPGEILEYAAENGLQFL